MLKSEAAAPKGMRSKSLLLVGTGVLALAATFIGWCEWTARQFEISTGDTDVQANGTPAPTNAGGELLLEAQQPVSAAGKATIAVSFRRSMIPF